MGRVNWVILTGEYPPQPGGVSDYTRQLAMRLSEAGDDVEIHAPAWPGADDEESPIRVRRLPDHYGSRGLRQLSRELDRRNDYHLLVQYVPHAYGYKAMNVLLARWLERRAIHHDVWIMFHEVAFPYKRGQPWRHRFLAWVTHWMARQVCAKTSRIFVSTPAWETLIGRMTPASPPITWLPVPSNLPAKADASQVENIRHRLLSGRPCVGHFGTFGQEITHTLAKVIPQLLRSDPTPVILLIGRGSEDFAQQLARQETTWHNRIFATGGLEPTTAAAHIAACDVMVQPYPDGVTCRRGSLMASLALGRPIVTNTGEHTESFWHDSDAVVLTPANRPEDMAREAGRLLHDPTARTTLADHARQLYAQRFDMAHTIETLRELADAPTSAATSPESPDVEASQ